VRDGPTGMRRAPISSSAGSQRAAHGLLEADAGIDVKQVGHVVSKHEGELLVEVKLPPHRGRTGDEDVQRTRILLSCDRGVPGKPSRAKSSGALPAGPPTFAGEAWRGL